VVSAKPTIVNRGGQLKGIAYIEFYVADSAGRIDYLTKALDFVVVAEARLPDAVSTLMRCGAAQIVITSPRSEESNVASWLKQHGEGVAELGFYHEKVVLAATRAEAAGLTLYRQAQVSLDGHWATTISGLGPVRHTLIEAKDAAASVAPPNVPWRWSSWGSSNSGYIEAVDHVEICVSEGSLKIAGQFFGEILGLSEFFIERIRLG
jgi:4-hydroxyphenylpyruvate dioxygenase-like putative hemolysin